MKVAKWVISAIIVVALVFGAYQGYLLNKKTSEQIEELAEIQHNQAKLKEQLAQIQHNQGKLKEELENTLQTSTLGVALQTIPLLNLNLNNFYSLKNPVLSRGLSGVAWDSSYCFDPCLMRVGDKWRIYYAGAITGTPTGKVWGIGYAEGTDIYTLTKYAGNPVLTATEEWEQKQVSDPYVIRLSATDWRMYYQAKGADGKYSIGYATSTDGITWGNKQKVLSGSPSAWGEENVATPVVFWDAQSGTQYLFFEAMDASYGGPTVPVSSDFGICIGLATASDWVTFTKTKIVIKSPVTQLPTQSMIMHGIIRLGSFYLGFGSASYGSFYYGFIAISQDLMNWYMLPKQYFSVDPDSDVISQRGLHTPILFEGKFYIACAELGTGLGGQISLIEVEESTPFTTTILDVSSLNPGASTELTDGKLLQLDSIDSLTLTVEYAYHASAMAGGKLRIYTSVDGSDWDTEPVETKTLAFASGATKRETFEPCAAARNARYLKVTIENLDAEYSITDVKVTATLGIS